MNVITRVVISMKTGKPDRRFKKHSYLSFGPVEKCDGYTQALEAQSGNLTGAALAATTVLAGLIPLAQHYTLGSGAAITITLQTPIAGSQQNGGDDGKLAIFSTLTAQAHIVQTAANKIQTNKVTATSSAAIGNFLMMIANGGFWWVVSSLNFTLA
jgi:hypothetical protein